MYTRLARYVNQQRMSKGWNRAELARRMGYRNVNRGMNRILTLEREGVVPQEVLDKLIDALDMDKGQVKKLLEQDRQAYEEACEAWLDKPIKMHLIVRLMPAVMAHKSLPEHITTEEEALAEACAYAKKAQRKVWLVVSRRKSIYVNEEGVAGSALIATPYDSPLPFMSLKRKKDRFLLNVKESDPEP